MATLVAYAWHHRFVSTRNLAVVVVVLLTGIALAGIALAVLVSQQAP